MKGTLPARTAAAIKTGTATSARINPSPWLIVLAIYSFVMPRGIVHETSVFTVDFRGETTIFVLLFAPEWMTLSS